MESFHDFKMVNNRSVVEQAHEIQCIAKELELLKCVLPDKFVAGCIIAKLPPTWRNFATTLKHKRQEISVENLIASFDVEEKARAKDTAEKGEGQSSANMVQKKTFSRTKGTTSPHSTSLQRLQPSRRRSRTRLSLHVSYAESPTTLPRTAQIAQIAKGKRRRMSTW